MEVLLFIWSNRPVRNHFVELTKKQMERKFSSETASSNRIKAFPTLRFDRKFDNFSAKWDCKRKCLDLSSFKAKNVNTESKNKWIRKHKAFTTLAASFKINLEYILLSLFYALYLNG